MANDAGRNPKTALIVGAGIGGLAAGIALRNAGWRIRIFERAASPRELGQGAAQAIVDAVTIGRELARSGDIAAALRAYESLRHEKTATLLAQGRRTANMMRTLNPVSGWLREVVLRIIPVKPMVKAMATINRRGGTDVTAAAR